jgi:hypothetical protein
MRKWELVTCKSNSINGYPLADIFANLELSPKLNFITLFLPTVQSFCSLCTWPSLKQVKFITLAKAKGEIDKKDISRKIFVLFIEILKVLI